MSDVTRRGGEILFPEGIWEEVRTKGQSTQAGGSYKQEKPTKSGNMFGHGFLLACAVRASFRKKEVIDGIKKALNWRWMKWKEIKNELGTINITRRI
jgi:hypothetical protein